MLGARVLLLLLLLVAALPVPAQTLRLDGDGGAVQGGVLRVAVVPGGGSGGGAAVKAGLDGDTPVPLFAGKDGGSLAGMVPVPYDARAGVRRLAVWDAAGRELESMAVEIRQAGFPVQDIAATAGMKALKPLPGEMEAMRALHQTVTADRRWEDVFAAPVPGCINSPFGVTRLHNGKPTGNYHRGLDQRGRKGTVVVAGASGVVRVAKMFRLHGGTVGIDHGQGVTSHYLHLSRILAKPGQSVKQGQPIGHVGATGFATGPHLHWGLYVHAVPVNPRLWLRGVHPCR